jgi:hypothetical protein
MLALLVLLTTLSGCVSTKERYERVQTYQNEGKVVAAAFEMVKVLDDEPNWPDGRRELNTLAQSAMSSLMDAARGDLQNGEPLDAVAALDRIDELRSACRSVDVSVSEPQGYAALRPRAMDASYAMLLDRAESYRDKEEWGRAVKAYNDARRFAPGDQALRSLDRRLAESHMSWAAADMDRAHFRSAFDRAETAASFLAEDAPMREDVRALQDAAVAEGTRVAAFLPLWQTREAADALPNGLLREINDVLMLEHWTAPPVFIASVPPVPLRRTLRRFDLDRTVLSRKQAARIGRHLETDFVVVGDIVSYRDVQDDVETTPQTARWSVNTPEGRGATRGRQAAAPTDTTFFVEQYERELYATVEVRIIDPVAGRTLVTHTIDVDVSGPMERGVFDGNWRNLDLSGAETSLFREEDLRTRERELELALADAVAGAVANETFNRILKSIP